MSETLFRFKKFQVKQAECAMKINTDGVLLGAWCDFHKPIKILDIGTGSGVIALMLAQRFPESQITGVEIDTASCLEAQYNVEYSPFAERVSVIGQAIQEFSKSSIEKFDLIVSNPPFFSGGTLSASQERSKVRHTIKLPHNELLRSAYNLLSPEGAFSVILPHIEGLRFIEMAEQYRLYCSKLCEVRSFPEYPVERLIIELQKNKTTLLKSKINIRSTEKNYSEEYVKFTKDFYLKM